jgi:hypothetical protein
MSAVIMMLTISPAMAGIVNNNSIGLVKLAYAENTPDQNGVMMYNYHGVQRKVYNPHVVASSGWNYYVEYQTTGSDKPKKYFLDTADWLLDHAEDKGNYSLWVYEFPWRYYGWIFIPPYYSALAQSEGIVVLMLAHQLTGEQKYIDGAKKAFNAFRVSYENGGLVTDEGNEMVFLHLLGKPGTEKIYVLNGHTNSLLLLWKYYSYTHDPNVKEIFDKGINYLKKNLWKYDTGSWSYYDQMKNEASKGYHTSHINQLKELYDITKEPILKEYSDRFARYSSQKQ